MRAALAFILTLAVVPFVLAAPPPKTFPVAPGMLAGQPALEVGKATGIFIWYDKEGLHVRWTSEGKPLLFTGRLDLDKPMGELKRIYEDGGGFVKGHGSRIVMFSATTTQTLDGFDLTIPGGKKLQFEIKIDGNDPTPEQVTFGDKNGHPKGFPLTVYLK